MTTWLLPALLALGQLALWPGLPLLQGEPLPPVRAVTLVVVSVVIAAGLALRRRRPVPGLILVTAAQTVATLTVPVDEQIPALLLIEIADLIALFSVAARCPSRTMLFALGGVVLCQGAVNGVDSDLALELLFSVVVNGLVAAFGRIRGRWTRDREAAARRLAAAEQAQHQAAEAERRRLARELHDVTAHHLTSIVVNAQAAGLLGDQHPELRDEALAFAARTGRDTLGALHRLVAALPAFEGEQEAPELAELAAAFRELGQRVTLDLADGEPPHALAAALHGIAREALTNTLRYAPGANIKIRFWYGRDAAEFVVEDDGAVGSLTGVPGLGGGRGISGMRDRAEALGGTLTAGPRDGVGWQVRASIPYLPGMPRKRRWLRSQAVVDVGLVLLALMLPLSGLLVLVEEAASPPGTPALVTSAVILHVLPVLWRRHRPWWVLLAVAVTAWLGPLLVAAGFVRPGDSWMFMFTCGAEMIAAYAVGAWGARPDRTWLAPFAATFSSALPAAVLMTVALADDDGTAAEPGVPSGVLSWLLLLAVAGVFTLLVAALLAWPMFGSWGAGRTARSRRDRRRAREEAGVASATALAALRARAERARIADGLRAAVLGHAAALPAAAELGDLPGVLVCAREALTAMRSLLDGLGTTEPSTPLPATVTSAGSDTAASMTGSDQEVPPSGCG